MNVAATRAKEEFYIIGDKSLYLGLGCDVATSTNRIIRQYKKQFPELVDDDVKLFKFEKTKILPETVLTQIFKKYGFCGFINIRMVREACHSLFFLFILHMN